MAKLNLQPNPFDEEENIVSWLESDPLYHTSLHASLKQFRLSNPQPTNLYMTVSNQFSRISKLIAQHVVASSIIGFLILSSVGVFAAQIAAPQKYKPSTILGITKPESESASSNSSDNTTTSNSNQSNIPSTENTQTPTLVSQTPTVAPQTPATLPQNATKTLSSDVVLKYASGFSKTTLPAVDGCEAAAGLVRYNGKTSQMTVYGPQNKGKLGSFENTSIQAVDKVIANSASTGTDLSDVISRFFYREGCGGFGTTVIKELTGYSYSNVDSFRIYYTSEGQSAPGDAVVELFARRGESRLNIRIPVLDYSDPQYRTFYDNCVKQYSDNYEKVNSCDNDFLISPKTLDLVDQKVKKIVADYELLP